MSKLKFQINRYSDITEFESAINAKWQDGWQLHSWQDCGTDDGFMYVVIFEERERGQS